LGYVVPFVVSIIMAAVTFITAFLTVPETLDVSGHPLAEIENEVGDLQDG